MISELPLNELQTYLGRMAAPDDFNEFWHDSVGMLHNHNAHLRYESNINTNDFAICSDLFFSGLGGAKIHCKFARPKFADAPSPAVILFHGYGDSSPDWFNLFPYVACGYAVLALDCRGQGGLSQDSGIEFGNTFFGHLIRGIENGPESLLFRYIYLDCLLAVRILMNLDGIDEGRIASIGASQGGGLAVVAAALEPKIHTLISIYPFLSDYLRVKELQADRDAYAGLSEYFQLYDPTHSNADEFFRKMNYIDVQHFASDVRAKTLMVTAYKDEICPPSTQFAIYNKITAEKEMMSYPDFKHEKLRGLDDYVLRFLGEGFKETANH
ncbi:MAG: alpha/beta fold hydrolase [Actinobacteria bacterium]|nr:alpha/beta fold hydrolase [Actinomycetota bacterium]